MIQRQTIPKNQPVSDLANATDSIYDYLLPLSIPLPSSTSSNIYVYLLVKSLIFTYNGDSHEKYDNIPDHFVDHKAISGADKHKQLYKIISDIIKGGEAILDLYWWCEDLLGHRLD